MALNADSNYSPNPWMQDIPIQAKKPAYYSYEDQTTYEALVSALSMPAEEIRAIRPRVGNVPFPPREGYEKHEPTLMDVLMVGPDTLRQDTPTKQDSGMQGTQGPTLNAW
jgi:hypothetical protein